MSEATDSEMAMFRAIFALAWADHKLSDEEQNRLVIYMDNNTSLSDKQRAQLKSDLMQPLAMDDVWPLVTHVRDRVHVLNVAEAILWEDGELCHSEKEILEQIRTRHMATLDLAAIKEDVSLHRQALLAERKQFQQELHDMRGPFSRMIHYMQNMIDRVA